MTPREPAQRHRGELYAALAAMGFGSAYVATSFALTVLGPVPAAVWRSGLAAILLSLLVVVRHRAAGAASVERVAVPPDPAARPPGDRAAPAVASPPGLPARAARLMVIAAFGGPIFLASMNLAVAGVGATIASFVAGLYAVLAAVLAPLVLRERLTWRVLAGFLFALGGTALLAELDPSTSSAIGMAWGLLAATSFALYLLLSRRWSAPYRLDGSTVGLANVTLTLVVLGGGVLATDAAAIIPSSSAPDAMAALLWLATVAALGPVLTVAAVRRIPAARSAAFLLLNPVTATILAAVLLGERPSPLQLAGGGLVLLGMAMVTVPGSVGRRRRAGPGVAANGPAD